MAEFVRDQARVEGPHGSFMRQRIVDEGGDPYTAETRRELYLVIPEDAMSRMLPEQAAMLADGAWLIEQALLGNVEGDLVLPHLRAPVR